MGEVMEMPRVRRWVKSERTPVDVQAVSIKYEPGFRLSSEGQTTGDLQAKSLPRWMSRRGIGETVLAKIEVGRREPDHEGAVKQMRMIAADLGAEALTDVGYKLWIEGNYYGGRLIHGWIYHGLAVIKDPEEEAEVAKEEGSKT